MTATAATTTTKNVEALPYADASFDIVTGFALHGVEALILVCVIGIASASAQSSGAFTTTGDMFRPRSAHTATLLPDGRALIAGGVSSDSSDSTVVEATAELFYPTSKSFVGTANMTVARAGHTATLLIDGRVLIAGGSHSASAELYDPSTGGFTRTANMTVARSGHIAVPLADGRVLIAGGWSSSTPLTSAELYDPHTGTFTSTGTMLEPAPQTATVLANGTVLITHSFSRNLSYVRHAELYDPATGTFTATGDMVNYRYGHTATLLRNGDVLIVGGLNDGDLPSSSVELYRPGVGSFIAIGEMNVPRAYHTATHLLDGTVLIAGNAYYPNAELYDPVMRTFTLTGSMARAREGPRATLLDSGGVLITGGVEYTSFDPAVYGPVSSAEVYTPSVVDTPSPYSGTPAILPGVIEAENFDKGGEGIAYHDTTSGNSGGAYRTTDVDIQSTTDTGGGYNVGWVAAGEWLKYTVNVTAPGRYTLSARVASKYTGGTFHIEANGVNVTGPIAIPNTGAWQTWTTVSKTGVSLAGGAQVLRIVIDAPVSGTVGNFNWLRVYRE